MQLQPRGGGLICSENFRFFDRSLRGLVPGVIEANGGRGMAGCSSAGSEMSPLLSADAGLGDLH